MDVIELYISLFFGNTVLLDDISFIGMFASFENL